MSDPITIPKVNNLLSTAFIDPSTSIEIISRLSLKAKYIELTLKIFADTLALNLAEYEDGIDYKIQYLDLLIKFINFLGVPFAYQLNEPEILNALSSCYNEHPELKKRVNTIFNLVDQAISFDKDGLEMNEYVKLVNKLEPDFKWTSRKPKNDFENSILRAQDVLRLGLLTNSTLTFQGDAKKENIAKILACLDKIKALKDSADLFRSEYLPIEYEFLSDIMLKICEVENSLLKYSKDIQKELEAQEEQKHRDRIERSVITIPRKKMEALEQELHLRTYFTLNEILIPDEGERIEYKSYYYPFNEILEKTLQKTICSFLNQKGGRIYLGVRDDDKKVTGLVLTPKDRDSLKLDVYRLLNDFYPTISHEDLIKVYFLPVCDENKKAIPGRVVVKILVKQGDQDKIYSVMKRSLKCFMRKDGFCKVLEADQIISILKKKWSPGGGEDRVNPKEFDDPKPENLIDLKFVSAGKKLMKEREEEKVDSVQKAQNSPNKGKLDHQDSQKVQKSPKQGDSNQQPGKKMNDLLDILKINVPKKGETHGFKLTGLPFDTTLEEVNALFKNYKLAAIPKLNPTQATNDAHAFINFYEMDQGVMAMSEIDGKKLRNHTLKMCVQKK